MADIKSEDIVRIITALRMKVEFLNVQVLRMGLFNEYILESLLAMEDQNGDPMLNIDMEKFPEWAEERWTQIQKEAQEQATAEDLEDLKRDAQAAEETLTQLPGVTLGVNLDE